MILAILHAELALLAASMILVLIKACYGTNLHKFVSIKSIQGDPKYMFKHCTSMDPQLRVKRPPYNVFKKALC